MLDRENEFDFMYRFTNKLVQSKYERLLTKQEREDIAHEVVLDRLAKVDYNLALTIPQKVEFLKLTIRTQIDSYLSKKRYEREYIKDAKSFLHQLYPYQKANKRNRGDAA